MPGGEVESSWEQIREELRAQAGDFTFHLWLEPLELAAAHSQALFLRAPRHIRTWVSESYLGTVREVAGRVLGRDVAVELVEDDWRPPLAPERVAEDRGAREPVVETGRQLLNPKYTFDQFVIGDANRLAHAAALAVAEQPAQAYNPLFIHGPPGLGKTHLLHAIGNYVQLHGGGLTVRYATVETFTNEFVHALREGGIEAFKNRFRETDVVLIDDVQFLADKARTKEEFFHSFNALYESGRQLVLTSDQPPADLDRFEARLRERFGSGLVADLGPPDYDVRLAILRKRAGLDALGDVEDATLREIAARVPSSVRVLEGALIRVVAYASLRGESASPALAREVLERLYARPGGETTACTPAGIRAATAAEFGVAPETLLAHDRRPRVALARQVAMYLTRELTDESLPAIGAEFGGRNHSTVLHAHRRVAVQLDGDPELSRTVDNLRSRLSGTTGDRA